MTPLNYLVLNGSEARRFLPEMAELRMKVFREYPYLYEGNFDYEKDYLDTYFNSSQSIIILCRDHNKIVGASTAISLYEESPAIQRPFDERGLPLSDYMYFGESVLINGYRGQGVGNEFFKHRLKFANHTPGVNWAIFCAVVRPDFDPRRPIEYSPLNTFWNKQGFKEWTGMKCSLSWKRLGEESESTNELQFWRKDLKGNA